MGIVDSKEARRKADFSFFSSKNSLTSLSFSTTRQDEAQEKPTKLHLVLLYLVGKKKKKRFKNASIYVVAIDKIDAQGEANVSGDARAPAFAGGAK
jgi:hypothetical protein